MEQKDYKTLSEAELTGYTKPQQANLLLTVILEELNATSINARKFTSDILSKYNELKTVNPEIVEISESSLTVYLSNLSKQDWSRISCPGKKQGYFLADERKEESLIDNQSQQEEKNVLEKDLYPYLEQWLTTEGYEKVAIIANKRGGKKWGNPDLLAINTIDFFQTTHIELTTVEAKKDCNNWRTNIFEAVAHTMFANRVYFAYRRKETEKDDKEMILYAQNFNIGLVAIVIPDEEWDKPFNSENADIQIIIPAPLSQPSISLQKQFMRGLEIFDFDSLKSFPRMNNKE